MMNGQYNMKVSKRMKNIARGEEKFKKFKKWECFVVWNFDHSIIKQISAYLLQHRASKFPIILTKITLEYN